MRHAAMTTRSHPCLGEAWRTRDEKAFAQVVPPGQRNAGQVEEKENCERQMRTAGCRNGGAEAARNQISPAGTYRADESERGGGLEARVLERARSSKLAFLFRLAQPLLTEDRR